MSGVPRTKVYSVLRRLIDMGLVVEVPGVPRKFAPNPPKTALKSYLDSYQTMVNNLSSIISCLEELSKKPKNGESIQRAAIWILLGREEILKKIREMLTRAKNSVQLVTNEDGIVLLYKYFNKLFDELFERSVRVKIVTSGGLRGLDYMFVLNELKHICKIEELNCQLPLLFLCTDERQLLLANLQQNNFSTKSDSDRGIYSDVPILRDMISLLLTAMKNASISQPILSEPEEVTQE